MSLQITRILLLSSLLLMLCYAIGCREEEDFITDASAKLEFSVDTLRFDTVFTQLGSATRSIKVFNRNKQAIRISKISLQNKTGVFFRINVDGNPGNLQENIEINGRDSIYVFAEVTVDPNQPLTVSPFVVQEELVFETNGNRQTVLLEAWGQNANYLPQKLGKGLIWSPCTEPTITWDDSKPYVIYGIMAIDNCLLEIPPGTQVYVHGGIVRNDNLGVYNEGLIIVLRGGTLLVRGTLDNPVTIQGDRLEIEFRERPGQWAGIIVDDESTGNHFEYATVKNSSLGIVVDSAASATLKNVQIFNTSSVGLAGIHSEIFAENLLIHSNGGNCVQLIYGGNYHFAYCTFASFGVDAASVNFGNGVCLDPPFCNEVRGNTLQTTFQNCILFGSRQDEISINDFSGATGAGLFYTLQNCIVRVNELTDPLRGGFPDFFDNCINCINAKRDDLLFENVDEDDYHLDSLSIAEEKAIPINGIHLDLEGKLRDPAKPDIGCFEYTPQ